MVSNPAIADSGVDAASPMIAQYLALKAQNPDCLLFYRMGDFYELFFDDAVLAAEVLGLSLTARGQYKGKSVAMCGVPWHAHEAYIARLVRQGHKVALSEQAPEEKERAGASKKALRDRTVVRLFTPGTLVEEALLDGKEKRILAAVYMAADTKAGIAWADLAAGSCGTEEIPVEKLAAYLGRLDAAEIVLSKYIDQTQALDTVVTLCPVQSFDIAAQKDVLQKILGDALAPSPRIFALAGLVHYIKATQNGACPRLCLQGTSAAASMEIDANALRNLEIVRGTKGARKGSLLHVIDKTVTAAGSRLLARWLSQPLADSVAINERLDAVAYLALSPARQKMSGILRECDDIERALTRLSLGRVSLRDLCALRDTLARTMQIYQALHGPLPSAIESLMPPLRLFGAHHVLVSALEQAFPAMPEEGVSTINKGYDPRLDERHSMRDDAVSHIRRLQADLAKETGIAALKIKDNSILGRFVEVPLADADRLLAMRGTFIHRQTLSGVARFTTEALMSLDRQILEASERARALELEIISDLGKKAMEFASDISAAASALAKLDALLSLASLAAENGYVRPIVDDSSAFQIENGRHPVVEAALPPDTFSANDCNLSPNYLCLVTGPNMAGKSTYLRQNALIAVLAQAGSFVPAKIAHIGVIDRLFSRIGAGDDLARAQSTFMAEMTETAEILQQATPKSLVIIDEVGRGTGAQDGLAIAEAVLEYLHDDIRCRTLFATHYHSLALKSGMLLHLSCLSMDVKHDENGVIFLHKVVPGVAAHSYGVHVARMAGVPDKVTARAGKILQELNEEKS